ncbi:hypothetical protein [Klebsiella pneumoniae]|uniref:hypothetical protein n=1 Tax=Klebsiella pneumoniae TaxID=573 RepID=UPI003210A45A
MTKSTITRERLEKIKSWRETYGTGSNVMLPAEEAEELASMALAAMDSEPYGFTDGDRRGMIYKPEHSDRLSEPVPVYRHAQPAPEYPEVLPCSVLLEPGLRFGKGIKTSTMLAALARMAVYESDMAALSPEERVEFQARIEDFKALIAQPAPVVPEEKPIPNTLSMYAVDAVAAIAEVKGWNACRAAMLEQQLVDRVDEKSLTSINPVPDLVSLQKKVESIIGNYPGIPDGSEHCPCCGKKLRRTCSVEGCGGKHVAHGLCQKHYDMQRWEDPEQVERFREAGRRYRGKKKSTVATPQEPKP